MNTDKFDTKQYIHELGKELVNEFEKSGYGTHPHAVGGGREKSVKNKLKSILPSGIGVGSGFIFDSYGNVSQQCDLIIYEENFALKFSINDDEANTYYNCESVIAVGEVKSVAKVKEIKDAVTKLKKIKELKRFRGPGMSYRHYNTSQPSEQLIFKMSDPLITFRRQIYTFVVCKELKVTSKKICEILKDTCDDTKLYLNQILTVDGSVFSFMNYSKGEFLYNSDYADKAVTGTTEYAFNNLIMILLKLIAIGETELLIYEPYIGNSKVFFDDEKIVDLL